MARLMLEVVTYIACLVIASIFAVVVFLFAATLFRKLRPIPMALISLILCVGFLINIALIVLTTVTNMPGYMRIMEWVDPSDLIGVALDWFITPAISILTYLLVCVASITAIFAVIPYKKSTLVQVSVAAEAVAEDSADFAEASTEALAEAPTEIADAADGSTT